jgi:5-methyltetrahydrofolate--homocysteine methyltransferase
MPSFLDTLRERVLVLDGAFGTWMQAHDLGPDDFGGPSLEGCNEHLVLTRPDLIRDLHSEFFTVGCDAVETATFGAFPLVLNEYAIPEKTHAINEAAARIAKEVAADFATPERPRWVVGSIGPGTKLPSLATRRRSMVCSPAVSTCCWSRPSTTCSRRRPRSSRAAAPWPEPACSCRSWCR